MNVLSKTKWITFWDLQCPYCRIHWNHLPALRERFGDKYQMDIQLTSLAFHPHAFIGQAAANLIQRKKGDEAKLAFINACMENQERYLVKSLPDARPSEVRAVFLAIAKEANLLDKDFTEEFFAENMNNWEEAVKPANTEHKEALAYGVFGTPKHVIDGKLVLDTESSWGVDEWQQKLDELSKEA